jgi:hypothetical protein
MDVDVEPVERQRALLFRDKHGHLAVDRVLLVHVAVVDCGRILHLGRVRHTFQDRGWEMSL